MPFLNSQPLSSCEVERKLSDTTSFYGVDDSQAVFDELMSKEPKPPKKPTNEHSHITFDTPEKPKQELEDMDEDEVIALSLF